MEKKLTDTETKFVEGIMHELDFKNGMYRPLTDEELSSLSPAMKEAVLIARDRARSLEHDE